MPQMWWQSCLLLPPAQRGLLHARDSPLQLPALRADSLAAELTSKSDSTCSLFPQVSHLWVRASQESIRLAVFWLEIWCFWILPWGSQSPKSRNFLNLTIVLKSLKITNAHYSRPEVYGCCRASSLQWSGGPRWRSQANGKRNPNQITCKSYN